MAVPPAQMVTTMMSYSETFAALIRKHNQGVLTVTAFTAARAALRNEVIDDRDFMVLGLEFADVLDDPRPFSSQASLPYWPAWSRFRSLRFSGHSEPHPSASNRAADLTADRRGAWPLPFRKSPFAPSQRGGMISA